MADFNPSVYQTDVFNFVEFGEGNAVINAVAGSGKTTTIVKSLGRIPAKPDGNPASKLFVAFNKTVVAELSTRVPKDVKVKTMHSYGFAACRYHLGNKVQVKNDKVMEIVKRLYPTWQIHESVAEGYMQRVCQIVDLARLNLVDSAEKLYEVVEHHGIEILNSEIDKAMIVFEVSRNFKQVIDMTDMIFLPAYYKWKCKTYDWVFADECQDFNRCQQQLLTQMIKPGTGRFVAVGDPRQAIYGFAGADAGAFEALTKIPNTTVLPLSTNYRCPKEVIKLAQEIVPQIEHHEGATDGVVERNGSWKTIQDGDYVLCRNVRPLVKLCIELLINDKKAHVRGRDIGANLVSMLRRTKKTKLEDAIKALYQESENMIRKSVMRGKNEIEVRNSVAAKTYLDKIQAIEVIGGSMVLTEDVAKKIETLFSDDKKGIVLSTVHKAKGLESENVYLLNSELTPSPWAKKDWEKEQEENLRYVAYTRAKEKLSFIRDFDGTK
jgi:superfamily I DNA/RNA helicase